ncbi:hypothetical protein B5807_01917 [Epicoccum nigrum]|uniref:BTB domain-containing protein n=1 Tax=Epicoccum nigrum TaxID=105696 RepID=A0A1Y2MAQ7_EPING|nr:hypothetical protein B5807_01917 [Epicoccum nigrum]
MVTIRVTDEATDITKDYIFHRAVLAFHSAFFAAKLDTQRWASMDPKRVYIPGSHEEWDVFNFWVNSHGFLVDKLPPGRTNKDQYLPSMLLYKMWIFADYYEIPDLTNSVIDMLHERLLSRQTFPIDIDFVYANALPGKTLRRFVADWYVYGYNLNWIKENDAIKPTVDFFKDISARMANRNHPAMNWDKLTELNRCDWHGHRGPGGKLRYEGRR